MILLDWCETHPDLLVDLRGNGYGSGQTGVLFGNGMGSNNNLPNNYNDLGEDEFIGPPFEKIVINAALQITWRPK